MARYIVVKGTLQGSPLSFADDLVDCVRQACKKAASEISSLPSSAFGTETTIASTSATTPRAEAAQFAQNIGVSHGDNYARKFLQEKITTVTRMATGYVSEQMTLCYLAQGKKWIDGTHYLYNDSTIKPSFPIAYQGRPDFRFSLGNGTEAVFDITTPLQCGHLLDKKVTSNTSIGNHPRIPIAVEIIWEDEDWYSAAQQRTLRSRR